MTTLKLSKTKKIPLGQGRSWQDASILESAGLNVVKTTKKPSLYHMLDGGRFDAFPRGANEVWTELSAFPDLKLTVEKQPVLIYPLPTYFFVTHKDPTLAKDIEFGLESAIKDGAFNRYFYGSPEVQEALEKADLGNRRAIRISNPYLPKATPLDRKELWLDLLAPPQSTRRFQQITFHYPTHKGNGETFCEMHNPSHDHSSSHPLKHSLTSAFNSAIPL